MREGGGDAKKQDDRPAATVVGAASSSSSSAPSPAFTKPSFLEISSEAAPEDPNKDISFDEAPVSCTCPHCERRIFTFTDLEASWVTYLLCVVVWTSLGWIAFWVLPLLWTAFKDVVHRCPRCLNIIARKSRMSVPTCRQEVMTFKVGTCAIVLARKYVIILIGLVGVIATFYMVRHNVHPVAKVIKQGPPSALKWDDFLSDFGPRSSLRHRMTMTRSFQERFRGKTFTWRGEVSLIREGSASMLSAGKSDVFVRMTPPRYTVRQPRLEIVVLPTRRPRNAVPPDIRLQFGENLFREVAKLSPDDWVEFEATMLAHGQHGDPEVMELWHIRVMSKPLGNSSSSAKPTPPPGRLPGSNATPKEAADPLN